MFQTATLYSIEVDYYHFGTCEMEGGSYFCGDHSCNTYKHVGEKFKTAGAHTISEHREDKYFEIFRSNGKGGGSWEKEYHGPSDAAIYHDGAGNDLGGRDPKTGFTAANMPFVKSAYGQSDQSGYPLRNDAQEAQYHLYDSAKLPKTFYWQPDTGIPGNGTLWGVKETTWDRTETMIAGACKNKCDSDKTCKGFMENRWAALHTTIKCTTIHMSHWPGEKSFADELVATDSWDFYAKYTHPRAKTWLHVPLETAFSPTAHGRRLEGIY